MAFWAAIMPFLMAAMKGVGGAAMKGAAGSAAGGAGAGAVGAGVGGGAVGAGLGGGVAGAGAGGGAGIGLGAGLGGGLGGGAGAGAGAGAVGGGGLSSLVNSSGGPLLSNKAGMGAQFGQLLKQGGGPQNMLAHLLGGRKQEAQDPERTPSFNPQAGGVYADLAAEDRGRRQGPTLSGQTLDVAENQPASVKAGGQNVLSRIWGNETFQKGLDFLGTTSQGGNLFQGIDAIESGSNERAFNKYLDQQLKRKDLSQGERDRYMAARSGGQKLTLTGGMTPTQKATAGTRRADYEWYLGLDEEGRRKAQSGLAPVSNQRAENATKMIPGESESAYRARLRRLYPEDDRGPRSEPSGPTEREQQESAEQASQWGFGESPEQSAIRRRLEEKYPAIR